MRLKKQRATFSSIVRLLLVSTVLLVGPGALSAENVLSKADVERIFGMRKADWEAYAPRIAHPTWKVRLRPLDTGSGVMALDPSAQVGLSIQPLYANDSSPPKLLIVGSFYPVGRMPNLVASQKEVERDAQRDLGEKYRVTAQYVKMPPSWEGIELTITPADDATK